MSSTYYRPFWDGPVEDRIARLERQLASPAEDSEEIALHLALLVLQQVRAESSATQLTG
jgi:hypothetical protein